MSNLNPYKLLRSRRLAIWLIIGLGVYAVIAAPVPQGDVTVAKVAEWRIEHPVAADFASFFGMHRAFGRPWFLGAAALLIASLIACSWERSVLALRELRAMGRPLPDGHRAWRREPLVSGDIVGASALSEAADALRATGMRVTVSEDQVVAYDNRWGLAGSPVFHWVLALLFLVVALSQATKSEGVMALTHGSPKPEAAESYSAGLYTGPLFSGHRDSIEILVVEATDNLVVDGVERGYSPRVRVFDRGRQVADEQVFPNRPLRAAGLTIHQQEGTGPSLKVRLTSADSAPATYDLAFATSDRFQYGIVPYQGGYTGADGATYVLRVEPRPEKRMALFVREQGAQADAFEEEAGIADKVELPGGVTLEPLSFGEYSVVLVASDRFADAIVALFALVGIAAVIPLFFPPRAVWVQVRPDGVRTSVRSRRIDPVFATKVHRLLTDRLSAADQEGNA